MKVSFIGLGVMGFPMAGHLVKAGFDVTVFNRTFSKAQLWQETYNGNIAETVADCVKDADVVLTCVGNDDDVRSMTTSESGALAFMKKGAILVDHTTTSAQLAEELELAAKEAGIEFMDAPVSGGQAGAENGVLTIMCGGEQSLFDKLQPVFEAYGKSSVLMGNVGQGQRAKMVNQICIAGVLNGLSEGLLLAEKSGLDIPTLVNCLKNGAAGSWQMENRAETMAQDKYDFGFAIDWMIKDLGFCLDEATAKGLTLPMTEKTINAYKALSASGEGRMDTSVLLKAVRSEAEK
ncbi:putative 3-hydroxyisobutyrate dehydrogenase [Vibrio nigripulchritudo SFn27]|uniref:Putative 3-hydroxyisobutyrate dehydrogenase n=1 Tax=Vibrio nigripulchritudo TaxID=28173 RepID=U4KAV4_9VIBR|nr:NAD(P)-dependent oxidoreductase [Vibrio nigripulchritudo]CCN84598.1 putative 3-hydroxyisobutyrate dehydrogenase [Vibrio nigripulchritudo BLFn1]CCN90881.1 putative 3-hydroxyisobutyrate dehydrogenase [Vibrio nigripulchritudo SFn27]CCN96186.1 putative 3-hydroxyisobutyrate dehydrogenase [Vibrio nigripulchritudo ENn2]CCO41230.1 putative 3-hydroxyisobutyrate dehydrogenase [Vibrio nigripulchritudo SFn135]CCO54568.1 putative 3-hydroxyisobutyrate dehydrogenase [Vibrio nigripulchritudo Wn13]